MAVYPCMHIVGVRPMYSSESLTQVVMFVWHVLSYLRGVTCVVYDFACGVLRHLRAQMRKRQGTPAHASWEKLLSLKWIVDKLHFGRGHTACKNESSTYYEPSVNPYSHDEIVGVDTEGAEQIFHVASRWQTNLSNSHAVHFDLQLIIFSNEHNERNRCDLATKAYFDKQSVGRTRREMAPSEASAGSMHQPCAPAQNPKRRKQVSAGCSHADAVPSENLEEGKFLATAASAGAAASGSSGDAGSVFRDGVGRDFLACELVCVNKDTVHKVVCHGKVWIQTKCSWIPPWGSKPVPLKDLTGSDLYACGTCCGGPRRLLLLD